MKSLINIPSLLADLKSVAHDLDLLQVQAGSSSHTSAILPWSEEAVMKFPSTVCTFGSGFSHSGGICGPRGWGGPTHVCILFCPGLRDVFISPLILQSKAVETQLG